MDNKKINILFMGTTDFSEAVLKNLLKMEKKIKIVGVVCQPDRAVGRKKEIIFSPVKKLAINKKLTLFQPEKIIDELEKLKKLNIDTIITCAYGQFLPQKILELTKLSLNVHASLLPNLRGGAPIHWAIIKNLKETGISLIKMTKKMDAGDIFCQNSTSILPDETYKSLKNKLITLANVMLDKYLFNIINGKIKGQKQNEAQVTFGLNINRTDELVNWNQFAELISCHIRGLYDIPIAYSKLNNHIYKIHEVTISNVLSKKYPGTITNINKIGIFVATKNFDVIIKKIQPEGKPITSCTNYFGSKKFPIEIDMIFN